jgi:hypothetical protein
MSEPDVIILLDQDGRDPRIDEDAPTRTIRVVLHRSARRILVELRKPGADAVGQPAWKRIDAGKKKATGADVRGAYICVERLLAEWYGRAIAAEDRVREAEDRVRKAEARANVRRSTPLLEADTKGAAKRKLAQLAAVALRDNHSTEEARSAALEAIRLMSREDLLPKIDTRVPGAM